MNNQIIEDEIVAFSEAYFANIAMAIDDCLYFIDQNELKVPKENYTLVADFLNKTVKKFRVMDSSFISSTLSRLNLDLEIWLKELSSIKRKSKDLKEIFRDEFIKSSPILFTILNEIKELEKIKKKSREAKGKLEKINLNYKRLERIYLELFLEIFSEDKKYYIGALMEIVNSKSYYLDKLLWNEAVESTIIQRHLKTETAQIADTKGYLQLATSLMRPYTDEYKHLQKCIRIYK